MEKILVIDDEQDVLYSFRRSLDASEREVLTAATLQDGIEIFRRQKPDITVCDIRLGAGASGLDVLTQIRQLDPKATVILMTAYGTSQTAIEAMKRGAYDYILKPFDVPKMKALIEAALKAARDMRQVVSYEPLLASEEHAEGIVGRSEAMQTVFKRIGQVAHTDATVLITGESGTGKELVARALYHHSPRAEKVFMAINCAAIPENLLESELFGHERGAFTGATQQRIGKFEQCDGGTLFLDEIGDMPLLTQSKILRVLQNGEFQRVGGSQTLKADARVIAATNKPLEQLVAGKQFREDLFYRLNVVRVHLPPLRERRDDVAVLVDYFLQRLRKDGKSRIRGIATDALRSLEAYPWPGNVRELENVVQRAAILAKSDMILQGDLPAEIFQTAPAPAGAPTQATATAPVVEADPAQILFDRAKRDPQFKIIPWVERELIRQALVETKGNQVQASKLLGITRATLRKRVDKFGIKRELNIS
ncbi:MAG: sigma-54-dependent Fis family transcriptional regulator [Verrucomicrobia bacterium]|nr:sigma-54-dependent Fis family transcriptional regulator [Verrucomicrobiota bacterium]